MPNESSSRRAPARRALIEDIKQDKRSWLQHGIAALAVSLLGLGVAGSVVLTGAAQHTTANTTTQTSLDRGASTSRDAARKALDPAKVKSLADQRAEQLAKADAQIAAAAKDKTAAAREKALEKQSTAAQDHAESLVNGQSTTAGSGAAAFDASTVASSGKACLPVTSGYTVAARFGQYGPWARYHTGFDFSAPVGTPLHAPADGVVTNAGRGPASGWAGNYVAIKYPDGTQSLMAHMSTVSVSVGQVVSACQVVGAIGMTGRTFGPHVHFEIYPAGITPGDVYKAVNPVPWLEAHGLKP